MSKKAAEHHKKASEHHTHAARHHGEAAKHYEAGQHARRRIMLTRRGRTQSTPGAILKMRLRLTTKNTAINNEK